MAPEQTARKRPLVLVVDDLAPVIRMTSLELHSQGFDVVGARVGDDTHRTIEKYAPDAAVMEVVVPGISGFELMAEIRGRYGVPVVFVTTADREGDRRFAVELGADAWITRPFVPAELAARLTSVLRERRQSPRRDQLRLGDVEIDLGRRIVRRAGEELRLSTNEWALLYALAARRTKPVAARDLLIAVWGGDYAMTTDSLEFWMRRLREQLEANPDAPRLIAGDAQHGFMLGRRQLTDMPRSA
jgi:two-component system KDP operon response regulator KdpE